MKRGPDIASLLAAAIDRQARRAGCAIEQVKSDWERWASATFAGARHRMTIATTPGFALDGWLAGLPESDFSLRGHLVADLAVAGVRRASDRVEIDLEILTVEER